MDEAIAEALAAVDAQYTAQEDPGVLDSAAAPDEPLAYDDEVVEAAADDEAETDDESLIEAEADEESVDDEPPAPLPWENPASPYYPQYLQFQQTAQQAQELQAQQTRTQQFLDAIRTAKEQESATAFYKQLEDTDPDMARQWLGQRTGMLQQVQQAEQVRVGTLNGAAAMHLAMEDVLGDQALVQQVVARSRELLATGGLPQMQQAVQMKRQAAQNTSVEGTALKAQLKEANLKLAARQRRQSGVDRVDPAQGKAVRGKNPADAETFDDFWESISPDLNQHFGWGS